MKKKNSVLPKPRIIAKVAVKSFNLHVSMLRSPLRSGCDPKTWSLPDKVEWRCVECRCVYIIVEYICLR